MVSEMRTRNPRAVRNSECPLITPLIIKHTLASLIVSSTLLTNTALQPITPTPVEAAVISAPIAVIVATTTNPLPAKTEVTVKKKVTPKKIEEYTSTSTELTVLGVPYSPSIARDLVDHYAAKWNVSSSKMWSVIMCEDPGLNPNKQSDWHYTSGQIKRHPEWGDIGDREKSYGLVQIHLPSNLSVSYAEATDPDFALNFLAQRMSEGRGRLWSCW